MQQSGGESTPQAARCRSPGFCYRSEPSWRRVCTDRGERRRCHGGGEVSLANRLRSACFTCACMGLFQIRESFWDIEDKLNDLMKDQCRWALALLVVFSDKITHTKNNLICALWSCWQTLNATKVFLFPLENVWIDLMKIPCCLSVVYIIQSSFKSLQINQTNFICSRASNYCISLLFFNVWDYCEENKPAADGFSSWMMQIQFSEHVRLHEVWCVGCYLL